MTWLPGANKQIQLGNGMVARWTPTDGHLGDLWRALEDRADGSFFQSWTWTGCLFAERFPCPLLLRVVDAGGEVLALGLFNRACHRAFLPQWHLAASGDAEWDGTFIEHNGPLVARNRPEARAAWYRVAGLRNWGTLGVIRHFPGIAASDSDLVVGSIVTDAVRRAPFRDLARLRARNADLLDGISANTRQQLNRALRRHEAGIRVDRAASVAQAREWLAALGVLHQATWISRGRPGAFASPGFCRFHEALIGRGMAAGTVDLLRISSGDRVMGYLYNFVWRGTVSAYQSGFDYRVEHPHEKPGMICHLAAIRYYQTRGLDRYDFLAGDDRYKRSLADGESVLHWIRAAPRGTLAGATLTARVALGRMRGD